MTGFNESVYDLVRRIPRGRVITYGTVARLLGHPGKARQVGWAMHQCPDDVPAQRVVNFQGGVSPGGLRIAADRRRRALEAEGVVFDQNGCCDLDVYGWLPD